eukprot:gene16215-11601_t
MIFVRWLDYVAAGCLVVLFCARIVASGASSDAQYVPVRDWKYHTVHHHDEIHTQLLRSETQSGYYRLRIHNKNMQCVGGREVSSFMLSNITESHIAVALIDQFLGPDEMLFDVRGKTLQSFVPDYQRCGSYSQDFRLLESGVYHLALVRTRSRYSAISEVTNEHPPMQIDYVVAEWMALTAVSQPRSIPCDGSGGVRGYWRARPTNVALRRGVFDRIDVAMASVPRRTNRSVDAAGGFYVLSFVHVTADGDCARDIDEYEWTPGPSCSWTRAVFTPPQQRPGPNVTVQGDSHSGVLSANLSPFVGVANPRAPFCQSLPSEPPAAAAPSWLFANCGHHPAAERHFSIARYHATLLAFATMLRGGRYTNETFAWVESNAQLFRQDAYVFRYRDWRTLHRLKLFNAVAEDVLRGAGFTTVVRVFHELLPFVHDLCDLAHYTVPRVYEPVVQQALALYAARGGRLPR